jgi:hypothetical protein
MGGILPAPFSTLRPARGLRISRLCVAGKLAFVLTPDWLYLPLARASGEPWEYIERSKDRQPESEYFTPTEWSQVNSQNPREWLDGRQRFTYDWVLKYCFADEPDPKLPDRERTGFATGVRTNRRSSFQRNPSARRTTLIGLATRPRAIANSCCHRVTSSAAC